MSLIKCRGVVGEAQHISAEPIFEEVEICGFKIPKLVKFNLSVSIKLEDGVTVHMMNVEENEIQKL